MFLNHKKNKDPLFSRIEEELKYSKKEYHKCVKELKKMTKRIDKLRRKEVVKYYENEIDDLENEKKEFKKRMNLWEMEIKKWGDALLIKKSNV